MKRILGFLFLLFSVTGEAATTTQVGPIVSNVVASLTDAATIAMDASVAYTFSLTLGGDHTLANPSNQVAGGLYVLLITQDGTGNRILSYGNAWRFPSATPPTLSTGASSLDALMFVSDGTHMNYLSIQKNDAAPITAPTLLVTTPGSEQCTLAWADNSSDETAFEIMTCVDSPDPNCDPTILGVFATTAANATGYVDSLPGYTGLTVRYAVRAKRGSTVSSFSNVAACLVL